MYRFPSFKHSNWLFFHEQYDGFNGKMFWWLMKKKNFWLWAGWVASYLQRSLSAQVNGGADATPNLWKHPFSAVRASGGYPGNVHSRKFIWNCRLPKWQPFCPGRDELIEIRVWISNYAHCFMWDVITYQCPNLNCGLTKLLLKLDLDE